MQNFERPQTEENSPEKVRKVALSSAEGIKSTEVTELERKVAKYGAWARGLAGLATPGALFFVAKMAGLIEGPINTNVESLLEVTRVVGILGLGCSAMIRGKLETKLKELTK